MEPELVDLTGAVFLRREALADGYTDRAIQRKLKSGEWHRVRHGAYVSGELWRSLGAADRHRLRARAVLRTAHPTTVLSHVSAALEHGAPVWGMDLSEVHVTRRDGEPRRREAGVVHHTGSLVDAEVQVINGVPATVPLRAAIEVTTIAGVEAALVTVDGLLRTVGATAADVDSMRAKARHWPGSLASEVVFRLADPRRESAAESRFGHLCWATKLPRPEPQVEVFDEVGRLVARLDFTWEEYGAFVEIDGREKYFRYRREGETLEEYLMREKKREERVCQLTGWVCIRLTWKDLATPQATARRILAILESRRAVA